MVRATYDLWNRGGLDAVAREYWHSDIELLVPPEWAAVLGQSEASGRDEVVAVYRRATAAIEDSHVEIDELEAVGDEFVVTMRFRGRGQSSGVTVESLKMFQVVRIDEGLVTRIRFFADLPAARAAAELDSA